MCNSPLVSNEEAEQGLGLYWDNGKEKGNDYNGVI